ncbi:MAG: dihydroneopterin 2',3'-cyclic phosphate phosphodiesterase [Candidatus Aenigmatarchaeota archaeon]|nr:MAG: dihydroneopterin 2',3'-cyclic phosphate phosphodiesterase [Candidatus Aenigmarchaeota archaeon ex4484_14]RLI97476.1 MAG: dihydroneopterin 2',3'-cyclic phosphate phosphodiesterase [Candidatus Aenigmarchaeota archaeon]
MKRLLKLAEKIKNKELRKKTIEFLKNPEITNKKFKYPSSKFEDAPAGPMDFHHAYPGGLLDHTYSVVLSCISVAENLQKVYPDIKINTDHLISAALLHDIMKIFIFRWNNGVVLQTDTLMDHGIWAAAELYARDFPEEVIHIVASHFGPSGPNPPQTTEAIILHFVDQLDAMVDANINFMKNEKLRVLFLPEEEKKSSK